MDSAHLLTAPKPHPLTPSPCAAREETTSDGELMPLALQNLSGVELTKALKSYIHRAQRGIRDAALVTGTGKDLLTTKI